eukprot:333220_1
MIMYDILRFFFAASHLVNKFKTEHSGAFSLKICVIPYRIVSIYDENVIFEYGISKDGITNYVKFTKAQSYDIKLLSPKQSSDMSTIYDQLQRMLCFKMHNNKERNFLIIVDRRDIQEKFPF